MVTVDSAEVPAAPKVRRGSVGRLSFGGLLVLLAAGVVVSVTLGVGIGPVQIPMLEVWQIAWAKVTGGKGDWSLADENIVWLLRFPRILLATLVGGTLAAVGVAMQAVVRNPLAEPYLFGISAGASVGAVAVMGLGWFAFAGSYALSAGAFLGALGTFVMVFLLARIGGGFSPLRLVLAGVACGYVLSGLTSFITLTSPNQELARSLMSWLLGSFGGATWLKLTLPGAVLVLGTGFLLVSARSLNALLMGDETAATLGIDVARFRRLLFFVMSLLTGVAVAVSGAIGFVGLVIPHVVRMFVGSDHRRLIPAAVLLGAVFMVWVDVLARMAFNPIELPIGVVTSLLGGPFFVWLLASHQRRDRA
jgi:iron complex transport system permease protein